METYNYLILTEGHLGPQLVEDGEQRHPLHP